MSTHMRFLLVVLAPLALAAGCDASHSDDAAPEHSHVRLQPWEERVDFAAFSPDGKLLLTGYRAEAGGHEKPTSPRALVLWDVASGKRLWMRSPAQLGGEYSQFAFFPDGKQFLVLVDGRFKVCDTSDGTVKRAIDFDATGVNCYAVSPDGKSILVGGPLGTVRLIDASSGKELHSMDAVGRPEAVAFSPDGKLALSASLPAGFEAAGASCLWDLETGKALAKFPAVDGYREPIAFAPDGKRAVIEREDRMSHQNSLVVFEIPSGKPIQSLPGQSLIAGRSEVVAFTADGKRIVCAGWDFSYPNQTVRKLELRDVESGKTVWSKEVDYRVAAFSPDGKTAFTAAGSDRPGIDEISLKLWDTATGEVLRELKHPKEK